MDQFGVAKPSLQANSKTPVLPTLKIKDNLIGPPAMMPRPFSGVFALLVVAGVKSLTGATNFRLTVLAKRRACGTVEVSPPRSSGRRILLRRATLDSGNQ